MGQVYFDRQGLSINFCKKRLIRVSVVELSNLKRVCYRVTNSWEKGRLVTRTLSRESITLENLVSDRKSMT